MCFVLVGKVYTSVTIILDLWIFILEVNFRVEVVEVYEDKDVLFLEERKLYLKKTIKLLMGGKFYKASNNKSKYLWIG